LKKMGKCLNYQNKGYIDAHLKKKGKEINKIVRVFLQMFPSFKREISF
jgi:predicted nucleic-acid-binding Zn-ribbon protein